MVQKTGFKAAVEDEYQNENREPLVYMCLDVYDPKLVEDDFENP